MPISLKVTVNFALLDELEAYIDRFEQDVLHPTAQQQFAQIEQPMLNELAFEPGPPNYPIKWKSQKQRRYVMRLLRDEAIERGDFIRGPRGGIIVTDLRYKRRRDGLSTQWKASVDFGNGTVVLSVSNSATTRDGKPLAPFVVGTLNQRSRGEAVAPIQPFHADRWPVAVDTVNFYIDVWIDQTYVALVNEFDEFVDDMSRVTRRSFR